MPKPVFLATDLALYSLLLVIGCYAWHALRTPTLRQSWRAVLHDAPAMAAAVVLSLFALIALLDSVHFRPLLPPAPGAAQNAAPAYATGTLSLLDALLSGPRESREKTYSVPLGTHQFSKESMLVEGRTVRDFPRLQFGGVHLADAQCAWLADVAWRSLAGLAAGALLAAAAWLLVAVLHAQVARQRVVYSLRAIWGRGTHVPWRAMLITASLLALFAAWVAALWPHYHVFGTDQTEIGRAHV